MRRKTTPIPVPTVVAPIRSSEERPAQAIAKLKARIEGLADLMDEFRLGQAEIKDEAGRITFRRRRVPNVGGSPSDSGESPADSALDPGPIVPAVPPGVPVTSPMNGIFYGAPSPSAPPFVREGESVVSGQVVGLIEAMKVFNEITASTSGVISKIVAKQGQIVQPGDPLVYIAVG